MHHGEENIKYLLAQLITQSNALQIFEKRYGENPKRISGAAVVVTCLCWNVSVNAH
jgi:hypothetical protein